MHVLVAMKSLTADAIFPKELLVIDSVLAMSVELVAAIGVCVIIAKLSGSILFWAVGCSPDVSAPVDFGSVGFPGYHAFTCLFGISPMCIKLS